MDKPKIVTMQVPEPIAEHGAAEKIAGMFIGQAETSFMRDIAPVILEKYQYQALDAYTCAAAAEDIDRALDIARWERYTMKCVPQFGPRTDGTMQVLDIIYKRVENFAIVNPAFT